MIAGGGARRPKSGSNSAPAGSFREFFGSWEARLRCATFVQPRLPMVRPPAAAIRDLLVYGGVCPLIPGPNRQNPSPPDEMAPGPLPPERPYHGPQGHMGPQTGFSGSAFSMRTTLVGGHLAQNSPQDRENPLFGVFAPFRAPNGAAKTSLSPDPPKTSESRIAAAGGRTIGSCDRTKVAQRKRVSDEPRISSTLPGGAELRPKKKL